jgi:hypothetical protein
MLYERPYTEGQAWPEMALSVLSVQSMVNSGPELNNPEVTTIFTDVTDRRRSSILNLEP